MENNVCEFQFRAYESDTPPLSPWRAVLDLPGVEYAPSFWEEHLALDLFYSAIHEAVNTKGEGNQMTKIKKQDTIVKSNLQAQGDRRRSVRKIS